MTSTVVILGSPRKGNSEAIAEAIANEAKAKGNEIKIFSYLFYFIVTIFFLTTIKNFITSFYRFH